ncbi:MAG: hypothetical protein IMX00_09120 [Limnochordales bacterium]|nr:hypothetical protein [Limnochordales bacterium]
MARFCIRSVVFVFSLILVVCGLLVLRKPAEVDPQAYPPVSSEMHLKPLRSFDVIDPYAYHGVYYKAQLHVHTDRSLDGNWSVREALQAYRDAGYTYVALTDHDKVTVHHELDDPTFVIITGEENTVPWPFWPLGCHILRLFVETHETSGNAQKRIDTALSAGGIVALAHPSWVGNLQTGQWTLPRMLALTGYQLVEVYNPHSDPVEDTRRWHELIRRLGPNRPVWAIAVDDSHSPERLNLGWIVVKTDGISQEALKAALRRGSFYASTGVSADFGVQENRIMVHVHSEEPAEIRFINGSGASVEQVAGFSAQYAPSGAEGFVRVEVRSQSGEMAWSQPFWLVPEAN